MSFMNHQGPMEPSSLEYREALEQLQLVNAIFVRTRRYRNLPGASGIAAGGLALAGGIGFFVGFASVETAPGPFIVTWAIVFFLAMAAHLLFSLRNANRRMEPLVSEVALLLARTIVPSLVVAVVLPLALYQVDQVELLAGLWMIVYGMGVLSCRPYVNRWVGWFGWSFVGLGSIHLLLFPGYPNEFMTFAFGLSHLVYGVGTAWADARSPQRTGQ